MTRARIVLAALSLVACAPLARVVRPGQTTHLAPDEGVIVIASEDAPRVDVRICRDGDRGRCGDVGPTRADGALEVYVVAAGRYCVMHVRCVDPTGATFEHDVPDDEARCFDVPAGGGTYPGHLHFDRSIDSGQVCAGRADWLLHETIDADLRAAYPDMGGHVRVVSPSPLRAAASD